MGHERLPLCLVYKQVTKVVKFWTRARKNENVTIEIAEEGSANRRQAEKKNQ